MRPIKFLALIGAILALLSSAVPAGAQEYSFRLDREIVDVFWESDGSARIEYQFTFTNEASASPIDFVDVGMPEDSSYSLSQVTASVDGYPIADISNSPYVEPGIALGLGSHAIPPGDTGQVRMAIRGVQHVLFKADTEGYASVGFAPTWFDAKFVHGNTDLTVNFHFPPGVKPEEPRWHASPGGWPEESPSTGLDAEGRILYTWHNPSASGSKAYVFGASFPLSYVPAGAITRPTLTQRLGISKDAIFSFCCFGGFFALIALFVAFSIYSQRRRQMDYLPPKISIEGHGIKRGLSAIEAAILLETPLDRVLTMLLFSVIKKGAARVISEDPLQIEPADPLPEDLRPYEKSFLKAMEKSKKRERERELQQVTIQLVKAVQKKMKGFSLKETKDYYRKIMAKAWKQVEEAETPEVRSEQFSQDLEWTMLDRNFDDRTRRVFRSGPVFVPVWWPAYRPSYRPTSAPSAGRTGASTARTGPGAAGRVALPSLPGGEFAASIVSGVQNTAGHLVSSLTSFTGRVTKTTNPPPVSTHTGSSYRGHSGGGCACACACACAGCACACAGGGR